MPRGYDMNENNAENNRARYDLARLYDLRAGPEDAANTVKNEFGPRLAAWMAERGLNPRELGFLINRTDDTIRNYCAGSRVPLLSTAAAIAAALNVTVEQLLWHSPPPHRQTRRESERVDG